MPVHRRVTPSIKFGGTHLYTWVEKGTVGVKCLAQEHNTMSLARTRTQTTRSGIERTNHEATTPPITYMSSLFNVFLFFCTPAHFTKYWYICHSLFYVIPVLLPFSEVLTVGSALKVPVVPQAIFVSLAAADPARQSVCVDISDKQLLGHSLIGGKKSKHKLDIMDHTSHCKLKKCT